MKVFKKLILDFLLKFGAIFGLSNLMVGEGYLKNLQVAVITVFILGIIDLIKYAKNKYLRPKISEEQECDNSLLD